MSNERDPDELAELLNQHGCDGYDRRAAVGLMRAISRAGLALVPAADVPTPERRAVLEAIPKLTRGAVDAACEAHPSLRNLLVACLDHELARRAAKEAKGG